MMASTSIWLDRRLWILASMTLLCPLAFLRKLDSLKVTSYIALCAIAYLVSCRFFCLSVRCRRHLPRPCYLFVFRGGLLFFGQVFIVLFYTFLDASELPSPGQVELFKFGPSFIQSLPVQIFGNVPPSLPPPIISPRSDFVLTKDTNVLSVPAFTCAQNIFSV